MIKQLNLKDIPTIADYEKNFIHNDSYNAKSLTTMIQNSNYHFYGYFNNDSLASYLIATINGNDMELLKIFTKPAFRHQHLATQLIRHLIKSHAVNSIFTEVNSKNTIAIDFYLKNDFKKLNTRKDYYGKDENAFVLVRKL
jgi:ribosomal-protein-alanine N-acetyltransferase